MQLTGERERIPLIYCAMAGRFAAGFAARYQHQHPNANPAEVQKAATEAAERFQPPLKGVPNEELIDAMIPVIRSTSPTPTSRPSMSSMERPPAKSC